MIIKLRSLLFLSILLTSGCATTTWKGIEKEVATPGYINGDYESRKKLYADLEKGSRGWRLTDIDTNGSVRLGAMSPTPSIIPRVQRNCLKAWFGAGKGGGRTPCRDKGPFVKYTPEFSNVFFVPFGIALAPVGILIGEPFLASFDVRFDYAEYAKAINEAKFSEEYDQYFDDLSKKYEDLNQYIVNTLGEYPSSKSKENSEKIANNAKGNAEKDLNSLFEKYIKVKVVDQSGFLKQKIALNDVIDYTPSAPDTPNFQEAKLVEKSNFVESFNQILPSKDIKEFKSKLSTVENTKQYTLDSTRKAYVKNQDGNAKLLANYKKQLNTGDGAVHLRVNNLLDKNTDFNVDVSAPSVITRKNGKFSQYSISVTVKSKDFEKVIPRSYSNSNRDIELILDGSTIKVRNNTNQYVTVDAISLYYNAKILTVSGTNLKNYIELSPQSVSTISINKFDIDRLPNNYYNVTLSKAKNIQVDFGFGVKYRITEQNSSKSLYKTEKYSLHSLI